ncbi:MAG: hypothetical protein PHE16_00130 [Aliarcobacter sp.]|nr:hypothetical protein [Aliarcobacter sp.]
MKAEIISQLIGNTPKTIFVWKKENRPIINFFIKYFSDDEISEFLNTGGIKRLDNVDNIANFVKSQIDDKIELPNTLQLFFIDFYSILKEIYITLERNELSDFYLLLPIPKEKRDVECNKILNSNIKYKYLFSLIDNSSFINSISSDLHKSKYDFTFYQSVISTINLSFSQKKDYLSHFENFCKFR